MKNGKFAFTMAEVIITISLIGVIAAITLPSVINSFEDKAKITRSKKAKFEISQAATMIQAQHPRWRDAYSATASTYATNVKNYFNATLKNSSDVTYYYKTSAFATGGDGCASGTLIIGADVGSGTPEVVFCASDTGSVEENTACTLEKYQYTVKPKTGKAKIDASCPNKATVKGS